MLISIKKEKLLLSPLKFIYWPRNKCLFIADLHLGKAAHFRKNGIGVPLEVEFANLEKFQKAIDLYDIDDVYILGDMFHSAKNETVTLFSQFVKKNAHINFHLILGNHDILSLDVYHSIGLKTIRQELRLERFILSHEPLSNFDTSLVNVFGHIHPGFTIKGLGRQSMRFPCFYTDDSKIILPAFGEFTGLYNVQPDNSSEIYMVIDPNKIIPLNLKKLKNIGRKRKIRSSF